MINTLSLLGATLALMYGIIALARKIALYRQCYDGLVVQNRRFTIAVLTPTMQSPANLFFKGFVSHLKKFASFEFDTLECVTNDNRELTYKWAEYIAENNIDLVLVLGKTCTDTLCSVMATRNKKIPIVSGGVPEDYLVGETSFAQLQEKMPFTAITSIIGWPDRIRLLKKIYPHLKRVLVLFRSIDEISHRNLVEKNMLTAALRRHHINWEMHHITNIEKSCELSQEVLQGINLVIISHSSELMPYASDIAQACQQHNVPVFSTDLSSPDIFIGISTRTEREVGRLCAQQAMQILEDGKSASKIPIKQCQGRYKVVVNAEKAPPLAASSVIGHALSLGPYARVKLNN